MLNKKQWQWNYRMHWAPPWMLRWVQGNVGAFSGCDWSFWCQFHQPCNQSCQNMYKIITHAYSSSLGNAVHMAAFMSKKGLIEHGIHRATCRKVSTASVDLVMISPGMGWPAATYLSSSWSCKHILLRTKVTISVRTAGGMVVVRRKDAISTWHIQVDVSDPDMWLAASELRENNPKAQHCCWLRLPQCAGY